MTVKFPVPDEASRTLTDMESGELLGTFTAAELREGKVIPFNGKKVRGFSVEKSGI